MAHDFGIVSAVTPDYLKNLEWCAPTWKYKPQFADKRLYVFHHGFKSLDRLKALWPADKLDLIEWNMDAAESQRELMLSAFVLGAAQAVVEPYFVKLDADTFFTDSQDVFLPKDFKYDLYAHKWGYTKPGWWVNKLQAWSELQEYTGPTNSGTKADKRIISWCCLHKTEFVRKCAKAAGSRLPVPSHDTFLWFLADRFDDCKWGACNLKDRGVQHGTRFRRIREAVCSNPLAFGSDYLRDKLKRNVQIEITTACNLSCDNCDRCCGTAPSPERMTVEQIDRLCPSGLGRIDLIGGEPTLHPDLLEICEIVKDRAKKIRLTTNGVGPHVDKVLASLPSWVQVRNSAKENGQADFESFTMAPCDVQPQEEYLACSIPWRCGMALTRYGFFLCGAGAAVARVHGIPVSRGYDMTREDMILQQRSLCRLCGHSRSTVKTVKDSEISEKWEEAFKRYKKQKPELTIA